MGWNDGFTKKEKQFIKDNFQELSIGEIALALGRSYEAVQRNAAKMNLHRFHKWTEEEDTLLMTLWGSYGAEYIARKLNVNANTVYNRVKRLKNKGLIANARVLDQL